MTADDVRARFEAWLAREMNDAEPMKKRNGDYMDPETRNLWLAWQAAHADLSGEVRELVEAARNIADERHTHTAIGSEDGGESCGICGHNWRSGVHRRNGESEQADKLRLKTALTKFTQEKNDVLS